MSLNFVQKTYTVGGSSQDTGTLTFYKKGFNLGMGFQGGQTPEWKDIILSGNTALTLTNAKAHGLNYVKLFGKCEQSGTPTPDNKIDVKCNNGEIKYSLNLANYMENNTVLGYWIRNNNGQPEASPVNFYTDLMPILPNTSYIAYGRTKDGNVLSNYNRIAFYDENQNWISNSTYTANTIGKATSPNNAKYARFHCNPTGSEVTMDIINNFNWVFQQGTVEVDYIPYGQIYTDGTTETVKDSLNNTAVAEMLLSVGDVKDVQEVLTGAITRNIGIKILDGTESWTKASGYTNIFYAPISGAYYNDSSAERIAVPCTHFVGTDATNTNMADNSIKLTAQGSALTNPLIYIKASVSNDTLTTWQNWLATQYTAGTPVIIIFPKKTATTESVTGQPLTIQAGTNIVEITQASIDNLELEVSYKATV